MTKRLYIGIGVQSPVGLAPLPKVHDAIMRIADYADNNETYDDPILFLDKNGETVTSERIRSRLTAEVLIGRPRILVHFCGHGAYMNGQEIWYLNKGNSQWSQRVDVAGFKDVLQTYGPDQIGIFSDACQTAEAGIAGGVPILDAYEASNKIPHLDVFRATIRGLPAFATKEDGPLFSRVISEALSPNPPERAFDERYLHLGERVVSSESLGNYVDRHLPDYAAIDAGRMQNPETITGFRYSDDDYLKIQNQSTRIRRIKGDKNLRKTELNFTPKYQSISKPTIKELEKKLEESIKLSSSKTFHEYEKQLTEILNSVSGTPSALITISDCSRLSNLEAIGTFDLFAPKKPDKTFELRASEASNFPFFTAHPTSPQYDKDTPIQALISLGDVLFPLELQNSPNTKIVNFFVNGLESGQTLFSGVNFLSWANLSTDEMLTRESVFSPMEVMNAFLSDTLTADLAMPLANRFASSKFPNPIHGIISAYLFDRSGNTEATRRLCHFFSRHLKSIPFDVAHLSRLPLEHDPGLGVFTVNLPAMRELRGIDRNKMPSAFWGEYEYADSIRVADGFGPLLRAGWGRLSTLRPNPVFDKFSNLRSKMTNAPFTTFAGSDTAPLLRSAYDLLGF